MWLFVFLSIALRIVGSNFLDPERPRPRIPYLTPPQIEHLTFGAKEQVADSLWLRAVQDFDYCEQPTGHLQCISHGWLFHLLDILTNLSPHFHVAYAMGGLALTVIVNDIAGASIIFDKGVKAFPHDWVILSRAAYQAIYEEKNNAKAAGLLKRAGENGGPGWYFMLASRLETKDGNLEFTEILIKQLEAGKKPDPVLIKTLHDRLDKARAEAQRH